MNSINSNAQIFSVYQTQDSNTTSWWLRIVIKHSWWRLISPFRDPSWFSQYLLFQFQKWLCFQWILTTTFRLPIQRNTFPLTNEPSKICPETCIDLIPGNSDAFFAKIKRYPKQFGYGSLFNIPTNQNIDLSGEKNAYSDHVNIINTWNKTSDDLIARNANEVWGTCNLMISSTKWIEEMTIDHGEVTVSALTKVGKKKFMEHSSETALCPLLP